MQNLLRESISLESLKTILTQSPRQPLLPPMDDAAWARAAANPIVQHWLAQLRPLALTEASEPLAPLTPELYAIFGQTGNRSTFEAVYFGRRRKLARAAMAVLLDPTSRAITIPSLIAKAGDICAEPSWCLPAHANCASGLDPMRIDLFAAETANLVGELLTLFPGVFPAGTVDAVRSRLHTQIFENYLAEREDPWWEVCTMNWNAVCHQGVVGAALALLDDNDLLARILHKTAACLPHFLEGFTADGGSTEGPGYWVYGFGWFSELNRQLEDRTGGRLSLFHNDPHVAAITRFGPALTLSGNELVNFSDSGHTGPLHAPMLTYLAARMNDSTLRAHALNSYRRVAAADINLESQRTDVLYLTRLALRSPDSVPAQPLELPLADTLLPQLGVLVSRGRDTRGHLWELAAKAGHNDEHHNHNDIGSFILNIDGQRALVEIGAPEYVRKFFSSERYTFLAARSLGHSLPLVNQAEQAAGKEFCGRILSHTFSPAFTEMAIDLTSAYPGPAGLTRCVRTFRFDKQAGALTITDTFELSRTDALETALITLAEPKLHADNTATLALNGITLCLTPAPGTVLTPAVRYDYASHHAVPGHIFRLPLVPRTLAARTTLAVTVTLD